MTDSLQPTYPETSHSERTRHPPATDATPSSTKETYDPDALIDELWRVEQARKIVRAGLDTHVTDEARQSPRFGRLRDAESKFNRRAEEIRELLFYGPDFDNSIAAQADRMLARQNAIMFERMLQLQGGSGPEELKAVATSVLKEIDRLKRQG